MSSKKNLWGELPNPETIRTPYAILKEQASLLSEITNGLLIGEVINSQNGKFFVKILRIKAPSLNNYTYSVVEVQHLIQLYPVFVKNLTSDPLTNATDFIQSLMGDLKGYGLLEKQGYNKCSSEEEFENALGEILSSQEVKQVISALLAQIHADIPKQ
ncbi:hypothetical protein [Allocoleopsis franciscana]|uniref:Uncharacterized protein n=1 Tax=Allocoleopsis franciscana PCC 7113 TaxID=1173027 RepID=K9WAY1_9CYAN|nr:hypothetical protein [Allocoleopsis franciscana]AFZ17530.1 hypothetical protein Mic7113_1662 [Allocoleopsis franciscana PCC 7113]